MLLWKRFDICLKKFDMSANWIQNCQIVHHTNLTFDKYLFLMQDYKPFAHIDSSSFFSWFEKTVLFD